MLHITKPDVSSKDGKRILFINPPIEEPYTFDPKTTDAYFGRDYPYPLPIGLMQVANHLLLEGNEIYFLDCFSTRPKQYPSSTKRMTDSEEPILEQTDSLHVRYFHKGLRFEEIRRLLKTLLVDKIFVGCTFTYHNEPAHRVIEICKELFPAVPVTFGGIYPTLAPEMAATSQADHIFTGAYPNLTDRSLNYDLLGWAPSFILIKGTSGCPFECAYCAVHKLEGRTFCFRPPEDVFEEIRSKHEKYGITRVAFWDSNILMRYDEYFGRVLHLIREAKLPLTCSAPEGFDYRLMTPEIARDLKAAGFSTIELALENSDDTVAIEQLNRATNMVRLKEAIQDLVAAGFVPHQIHLFIIVGLPDQTLENILLNIRYAWALGCNATLFPFTPIPGTKMYEDLRSRLDGIPYKQLHPTLDSCVDDPALREAIGELKGLDQLSRNGRFQGDHFKEVIHSPALRAALSV